MTVYRLLLVKWCRNFLFLEVNLLWLAGSTHPSLDSLWVFYSGISTSDFILLYEKLDSQIF